MNLLKQNEPNYFIKKAYRSDIVHATNENFDIDFTMEEANILIDQHDAAYVKELANEQVKGTFTMLNAIESEIEFHKKKVNNSKELGFGNSVRFGTHCINILNGLKKDIVGAPDTDGTIDPIHFMNAIKLNRFLIIEAKAKNKIGEWNSKIKCAAFCELLWENDYLGKKNNRVLQCNNFAKGRYFDIKIQLESSTKKERELHKTKLKYLFSPTRVS